MNKCTLNINSWATNPTKSKKSFSASFKFFALTMLTVFLGNYMSAQEDADLIVQCLEEVTPPSLTADLPCEIVSDSLFSSETGAPSSQCDFSTAFGPGDDWALWLPNQSGFGSDDFVPTADLSFTQYTDGTANLTGQVENSVNSSEIFILDIWFANARDWTDWQALGRYYKDDASLAGNNFQDWTYYELVAGVSTATGAGDLAGDILYFSHNPADFFFGFQLGEAANNKNENFGFSGWFDYTGTIDGQDVSGNGDINADGECIDLVGENCPHNLEFTYLYTATDACGNIYVEEYVIEVNDDTAPVFEDGPADMTYDCGDEIPAIGDCVAVDNCSGVVTYGIPLEESNQEDGKGCYTMTRTWVATDVCGNEATHIQIITVVDNEAPTLVGTPDQVITVECDEVPDAPEVTAEDNCSDVMLSDVEEMTIPGSCPNTYTITRTWMAEDMCGNAVAFTQTINVVDTEAPTLASVAIMTAECDQTDMSYASATDNCSDSDDITITYEDVLNSGGCMGVLERVYTATDECGNSSVKTQYITLIDTTAPVFECVELDSYQCVGDVPAAVQPEVTDNCTDVTVTLDEDTNDENPCSIVITRTWTATDYCGNMDTCTQTITVADTEAPEFGLGISDGLLLCGEELPAPLTAAQLAVTDNCGDVTLEVTDEDPVDVDCISNIKQTVTRVYRAFDACGNSTTMTQTFSFTDTTPPTFTTVLEPVTISCNEDLPTNFPEAEDNCGTVTVTEGDADADPTNAPCTLIIIRNFIATDECGNESYSTQVITQVDNIAPVFVFGEDDVEIESSCSDDIANTTISAVDEHCDNGATLTFDDMAVSGGCAGRIIRTFTATDDCSNSATFVQVINLVDDSAPTFTEGPEDMTVECGTVVPVSTELEATDECDDDVVITYDGETMTEGTCANNYTIVRTWTATDHCENMSTYTQEITVEDTTDPIVTAPADMTLSCTDDIDYGMAEADDNCSEISSITPTVETTMDGCITMQTVTWTATDECGNEGTATQTVTIMPETPTWTILENVTQECDDTNTDFGTPVVSSECSTATATFEDNVTIETLCLTVTERTYTLTDDCLGVIATQTQTITKEDTTAPVITGPVNSDLLCSLVDDEGSYTASATDNCTEPIEITLTKQDVFQSGDCGGQIVRTWVATDLCGNESAEFVQIIDLFDDEDPEPVDEPADLTLDCNDDLPVTTVVFMDNCDDEVSVMFDEVSTTEGCTTTYTRTWLATDHCGNEKMVEQVITVTDNENPELTIPGNSTYECIDDVPNSEASATDNCSDPLDIVITFNDSQTINDCGATITRTWTATDICGNDTTMTQTITVIDTIDPTFEDVPTDATHLCSALPSSYGTATATDNCDDSPVVTEGPLTLVDDSDPCNLLYSVTYTATDACGNESTHDQMITVIDNQAPTFDNMPTDITVQCTIPAFEEVTATDNCGTATVTLNPAFDLNDCGLGTITVTYNAQDGCENAAAPISYVITIVDTTAPVLINTPSDLILDCEDSLPEPAVVTATDTCDDDLNVMYSAVETGDAPTPGSLEECTLSTPAGGTCDNNDAWSLRLFEFPNYEFFETVSATLVQFPPAPGQTYGTAVITGSVQAINNSAAGFDIYVELDNGMGWDDWSSQSFPTSFKDDCQIVTDEFEDWTYYIINSSTSTLTGTGTLAGSSFDLTQAPSNFYYGYQVGTAANNVGSNFGNGGWFTAEGTLVDSENNLDQTLDGVSGDFAFDADCCPEYEVVRTWSVTDCAGNTTTHTQTITFEDLPDEDTESPSIENSNATDFAFATPITTFVYPNPAVDNVNFEFKSYMNDKVTVSIYNIDGSLVETIFSGNVQADLTYRNEFNTSNLKGGVYIFQISGRNGISTEKFIVTK